MGSALGEVSDVPMCALDGQTKVNQLHFAVVLVTTDDDVFELDVPVDHVNFIVEVFEGAEQALHDLSTDLFRYLSFAILFFVLVDKASK